MSHLEYEKLSIGDRVTIRVIESQYNEVVGAVAGFLGGKISVRWPDGKAFFYPMHVVMPIGVKNEVFNLRGAWRLIWNGVVPATTWADKGGAEAQLSLLRNGYSVLCTDGRIKHVGAMRCEVVR